MADRKFRVVVAGAGVSGLFMAETLKRAQIDFTVYEKAGEVGGTWRDNTFPGLFVDVLSRQYEFPFQPNYDWSRKYAPATEIWDYIKKVARDRGLTKFIRFNEEITGRGSPTAVGISRPPKVARMSRTSSSAPPAFCTSRSTRIFRGARVLRDRRFTPPTGITACPIRASTGV
jgi:hypothetical protein